MSAERACSSSCARTLSHLLAPSWAPAVLLSMAHSKDAAAAEFRHLLVNLNADIRREKALIAAVAYNRQAWTLPAIEQSLQHECELDRVCLISFATALRTK